MPPMPTMSHLICSGKAEYALVLLAPVFVRCQSVPPRGRSAPILIRVVRGLRTLVRCLARGCVRAGAGVGVEVGIVIETLIWD
jgi:hypothetical protein